MAGGGGACDTPHSGDCRQVLRLSSFTMLCPCDVSGIRELETVSLTLGRTGDTLRASHPVSTKLCFVNVSVGTPG